MHTLPEDRWVSDRTQEIFHALVVSGSDLASLLALISSAYADGGNHVLDRLHEKAQAASD